MPRTVTKADLEELVREHRLIQVAADPARPAYHVSRPQGRKKAVLTDNYVRPGDQVSGYVWLSSLPDAGAALCRRLPGLQRVGTGGVCVRVQDLGLEELRHVVAEIVRNLEGRQ